ncbi:hypothetical protein NEDG_01692 [Nematocida displodere]|uniref:Uncharacterized protein n=1 Tax=Nematocida displodere TaxID=1805483 RepID=A0A177EGJ0_9MICR|nr:hypothetical protein NEDG_01692 [Nematocida displodere]
MDALFRQCTEELLSALEELKTNTDKAAQMEGSTPRTEEKETERRQNLAKRQKLIERITRLSQKADLVYRVSVDGFEGENKELSHRLFAISKSVFDEVENKEVSLKEAEAIIKDKENLLSGSLDQVLAYASKLAKYSKCPLLWTEGVPLEDTFPAFPTEAIIQHSILREQETPPPEQPKATSTPKAVPPPRQEKEFEFDF